MCVRKLMCIKTARIMIFSIFTVILFGGCSSESYLIDGKHEYEYTLIATNLSPEYAILVSQAFEISRDEFENNTRIIYILEKRNNNTLSLYVADEQIALAIEALIFFREHNWIASNISLTNEIYQCIVDEIFQRRENYRTYAIDEAAHRLFMMVRLLELLVDSTLLENIYNISGVATSISIPNDEDVFTFGLHLNLRGERMNADEIFHSVQKLMGSTFRGEVEFYDILACEFETCNFIAVIGGAFNWP